MLLAAVLRPTGQNIRWKVAEMALLQLFFILKELQERFRKVFL
jgi:hypothetical protein